VIQFKDWHSFHRYKSGGKPKDDPPWIYLRRSWQFEEPYCHLSDQQLGQLVRLLWLAMQTGNQIPDSLIPQHFPQGIDCKAFEKLLSNFQKFSSRGEEMRGDKRRGEESTTAAPSARPPAAKKPRQVAGPIGNLLRTFNEGHLRIIGLPYSCPFAKDTAALKRSLQTYTAPQLERVIGAFWREQRETKEGGEGFIGKATPTVCGMIGQIPNILRIYKFDDLSGGNRVQ